MQTTLEKMAFSVRDFCTRNGISTPTYYKMRAAGYGPREMRFGSVVRISVEAEIDWRYAREHPGEAERVQIERQAQVHKRRSDGAVARTNHVANAMAGR